MRLMSLAAVCDTPHPWLNLDPIPAVIGALSPTALARIWFRLEGLGRLNHASTRRGYDRRPVQARSTRGFPSRRSLIFRYRAVARWILSRLDRLLRGARQRSRQDAANRGLSMRPFSADLSNQKRGGPQPAAERAR
jgi:hypothetical protein